MTLEIEVWLRGTNHGSTDTVEVALATPRQWTENDVRLLLEELLRAIDRAKNPEADRNRPVILRGFNWIVSPFEDRGVLVQLEIQLGAAAAGPFDIDPGELEALIGRVLAQGRADAPPPSPRVH